MTKVLPLEGCSYVEQAGASRNIRVIFNEGCLVDYAEGWPELNDLAWQLGDYGVQVAVQQDVDDNLEAFPAVRSGIRSRRSAPYETDRAPWQPRPQVEEESMRVMDVDYDEIAKPVEI